MDSSLHFQLFQPKGRLSDYVQGVWSASVPPQSSKDTQRWLQSDACSGILFNLHDDIHLNNTRFPAGVILLPVNKQAQQITLPPGSKLAGLRFHPAIGIAVLGAHYDRPTYLHAGDDPPLHCMPYVLTLKR